MSDTASASASNSPPKGFSILQPALGAALSWMPPVGSPVLEQLIDAYLPGPVSAQEKRAAIAMDFFEYSARTGENFKYYPVALALSSPAVSVMNTSPTLSDLSFYDSPSQVSTSFSTPASTTKTSRSGSQKSAAKPERTDFSHLPGMKIMTTTGEDVTNSVSRGCKTKEQREHAHLMRVLKACDACKRKKIRCDPSHKRKAASQTKVSKAEAVKTAKKAKKTASVPSSQASTNPPPPEFSHDIVGIDDMMADFSNLDQSWDDLLSFNDDMVNSVIPDDFYGAVPQDLDFFLGTEPNFSPANSGSSRSTDSPNLPLTPEGLYVNSQTDLNILDDVSLLLQLNNLEPTLPYLTEGVHGSNYVDFNLYSPPASFMDDEPIKLTAGGKTNRASTHNVSAVDQNSSQSSSTSLPPVPQWQVPGSERPQQGGNADVLLETGISTQQSWHADDGGNSGNGGIASRMTAVTSRGLLLQQQLQQRPHPLGGTVVSRGAASPLVSSAPASATDYNSSLRNRPVTATNSASLVQHNPILFGDEAQMSQQVVSRSAQSTAVTTNMAPRTWDLVTDTASAATTPSNAIPSLPAGVIAIDIRGHRVPLSGKRLNGMLHDGASKSFTGATNAHVQDSGRIATVVVRQSGELRVSGTISGIAGLTSSSTHGSGQTRPLLHGKTAIATSSSSTPRRPSDKAPTSLIRQLLSQPSSSSMAAQLAVFGLVSLLLLLLTAVVGFAPLLQNLQKSPTYALAAAAAAAALLYHYLPSSTPSVNSLFKLLTHAAGKSATKASNALDSVKSRLGHSSLPRLPRSNATLRAKRTASPLPCF
ncbi:hypothetical protein BD289DRAFT_481529 [Coniella lustricola]|uniref:Zn(2)-C6 fungal-type domain-containing protein n=1 Tax=Coniella lustricola TaxID=2025994 RepID=A0A2T3ABZ9_9PEZI|nr:hypothetical protein BD289DRAFT_481529 [Coniella lustricola]